MRAESRDPSRYRTGIRSRNTVLCHKLRQFRLKDFIAFGASDLACLFYSGKTRSAYGTKPARFHRIGCFRFFDGVEKRTNRFLNMIGIRRESVFDGALHADMDFFLRRFRCLFDKEHRFAFTAKITQHSAYTISHFAQCFERFFMSRFPRRYDGGRECQKHR